MSLDIDAIAVLYIEEFKALAEDLARLKGWNINSAKGMISCLPAIVKNVERVGQLKDMTGAEKQDFAVAIILKLVKLPWWLPVSFVKPVLEGAVNAVVEALKDKF